MKQSSFISKVFVKTVCLSQTPQRLQSTSSSAPNSAQEPTRGRYAGPPAEPARESSERHGGTPPAARRLTCADRRAASVSAHGPPRSSVRSVRRTEVRGY